MTLFGRSWVCNPAFAPCIDYAGIPKDACTRLAPYTSNGNGAAGIGTCSTSNGSANVIKAFKEDCPFGQAKEETWRVNSTKHASGQWFTSTLELMAAKSACR